MANKHSREPIWILHNGVLRHVSDFASLPAKERPPVICPVCQDTVILKLGTKISHHYAHRARSTCPTNHEETALHIHTKFHIYDQLRTGTSLFVEEPCAGTCGATRTYEWASHWHEVRVEYGIKNIKPDIVCVFAGTMRAIEIVATHPVDDHKERLFLDQNIPWIEVQADERIYSGNDAWTIARPLPTVRVRPQAWICETCKHHRRPAVSERITHSRLIDFYYPSGRKYRQLYLLVKKWDGDACIEVRIETKKEKVIGKASLSDTVDWKEKMKQAFVSHIKQTHNVLVDTSRGWQPWAGEEYDSVCNPKRFPFRYRWNPEQAVWCVKKGR